MGVPSDIESLKAIFRDNRVWIGLGQIVSTAFLSDRSVMRAQVTLFPDQRVIVAQTTWDIGPGGAGVFLAPQPEDLVLLAYFETEEHAFIIRRLSSTDDLIPAQVVAGHTMMKSLAGKKTYVSSDTKICLGSGGASDPTEPLVLGLQLKTLLENLIDKIVAHTHVGNLGSPTSVPSNAADFVLLKASPVADNTILSSKAFTE